MGLLDWSLAAAGSEAVFSDFNGEGHRTGTYGGGRRGTSCTGPTGPEHSQRRTDRTEIRALQSDGTTIVSIYQIALKFVGSSQLLAW